MPAIPPTSDFNKASITKDGFHAKFLEVHAYLTGLLGSDGVAATARGQIGLGTAATKNTGVAAGEVPLVGTNSATELLAGTVELATSAEAQAFTDVIRALTPATLAEALKGTNQSLATSGYQKFPGGLIMQWGTSSLTASGQTQTFPLAFPTACISIVPVQVIAGGPSLTASNILAANIVSASQFTVASNIACSFYWIAIGY